MTALEMLTLNECWDRLRSQRVGRIGFDRGRGPRIHPVGYAVHGGDILVPTSTDSELGMFVRMFAGGSLVSFETDQVDESRGERWSVLVGACVAPEDDETAGDRVPEAPAGHDGLVVVTGRRMTGARPSDRQEILERVNAEACPVVSSSPHLPRQAPSWVRVMARSSVPFRDRGRSTRSSRRPSPAARGGTGRGPGLTSDGDARPA